ncbi:MAG: CoA transferase subunit A [Chloroflexi bacterium]|nr:CoA transferase subunit A [Chloroflexota bacterium]
MSSFVSLAEAAALVRDATTLALGGMTLYRRPLAFVRALLQRAARPRDLTLLCFTAGLESDLLVGAGCVGTVRSCYFGLQDFGFAPMFTAAAQEGKIRVLEETEASIVMGIRARMAGVGFMPARAWQGTDLLKLRPDVKSIIDPYTGETLTAFPALRCDTAVLHALEADYDGNVKLNNNLGIDNELAYFADRVIVTAERFVKKIERATDGPIIPAPAITCIAEAPRGAWPTSCYPLYPLAGGEFLRYIDACNAGKFDSYLSAVLDQ